MARRPRDSARDLMRDAVLDVAAEEVVAHGWDGLQVRAVATRAGVSRQTVYNAFGDKHGLAEALILRLLDRFLEGIDAVIGRETTLRAQWEATVRYTLETAATEALLRAVLTGTSSDEFLPLLTSDGGPVITRARDHVAATLGGHHPDLDPRVLSATAETVTRLTVSHIVLPLHPPARVAAHVADLATAIVAVPR
ncbi:TetR family transcriptional regulator [Actinomycetospora sp. TBRC 11914]|uniref:TetR/AcrR family transcriptional regulator n=1 Tax=Actinomycetospora sp. TBRC 11914 TaxID=2729387 RepID=UPI00145C3BEE|nr:TetR family transcriptional regulator [Actinomycetospora sp. TBRC 11914]NMO92228.1 TetR/AcrR family transcriptional regulator [Actinomycetospora sp. TBRC 11914]